MKRRGTMKTTRLRKVECSSCGYVARVTRSWMVTGLPLCGNSSCRCFREPMTCADPADAIECGLLSLDDLPRTLRTQICKANGWEDEIVRTNWAQDPNHWRRQKPAVDAIPF